MAHAPRVYSAAEKRRRRLKLHELNASGLFRSFETVFDLRQVYRTAASEQADAFHRTLPELHMAVPTGEAYALLSTRFMPAISTLTLFASQMQ